MSPIPLPRIALTVGDLNGIGAEVMVKALAERSFPWAECSPIVVGSRRLLADYLASMPRLAATVTEHGLTVAGRLIPIVDIPSDGAINFGRVDAAIGKLAGDAVARAVETAMSGNAAAVVTMPISKSALHRGGYKFPGHTELIASLTGGVPLMILMTDGLRVALATIHEPLAAVPRLMTSSRIESCVRRFHATLQDDFGVTDPLIAVLGLNPHAGEEGEIGREEIEIIAPTLDALRAEGLKLTGPVPADGFFARFTPGRYDGVLAMYHDQGLIPLKFFARGGGVNFTAGLPVVRVSPDHGVAFDIAGRGVADPTSSLEAIRVALDVAQRRALGGSDE